MRPSLFYIGLILLLFSCKSDYNTDPLSKTLGHESAQRDYEIFRKLLEDGHPGIYDQVSKSDFNFKFDSVGRTVTGGITLRDLYNKLQYLVTLVGCSHSAVFLPGRIRDTLYNRPYFFPLNVTYLNKRLLVNSDETLPHGTQIISINGTSVDQILDSIRLYNSVDGVLRETQIFNAVRDFGYQYYLRFGPSRRFTTEYKDTIGRKKTGEFKAINYEELQSRIDRSYYYDPTDVPYWFTTNEVNGYAILVLRTFDFDSDNQQKVFESFIINSFELLKKKPEIRNLIIDLRENTGGRLVYSSYVFSFLSHNEFREFSSASSRIGSIPNAGYLSDEFDAEKIGSINADLKNSFIKKTNRNYVYADSLVELWYPDELRFTGSVYVVTNSKVSSSASGLAAFIKNSGRGKIIGMETDGGGSGTSGFSRLSYILPNSRFELTFPYAKIRYSFAGRKTSGGVMPDHLIPDNDSTFMNNEDTQLIYIVDSLLKK